MNPAAVRARDDIEEQGLGNGSVAAAVPFMELTSVALVEIDLEDPLDLGLAAVAQAFAVALVDQQFVIVERDDFAHAGAGR